MADLGAFEIDQLLQGVDKLERPATTARVKAVLSAMFHAASLDKSTGVRFNFVPGIKIEPFSREPRIAFTPDEIEKLKTEVPEHYHLLIDTILGTCLRWEEAMGLKKENVRNIRGEDKVIVAHTLHELKSPHNWEYKPRTKTGKPRQVTITPKLAARIAAMPDGFLFLDPDGNHIRLDRFRRKVWKPALKAIGLDDSGLTVRDLRRTAASWLLEAGAPRRRCWRQRSATWTPVSCSASIRRERGRRMGGCIAAAPAWGIWPSTQAPW